MRWTLLGGWGKRANELRNASCGDRESINHPSVPSYHTRHRGGPHSTLLALLTAKQEVPGSNPGAAPPKRKGKLFKIDQIPCVKSC